MKTITKRLSLLAWIMAVCLVTSATAQDIHFLPSPDKMDSDAGVSSGTGDYDPGTILVGAVPPNSAGKPVLVFIHGYTGSASTWFSSNGNDMYDKAYAAGHRTAFVTVYPDRSMWDNGNMFAGMLPAITNYYGVSKVVVVAHSKGGLDTDAAVNYYGASAQVDRVISLGSPHYGSPLADLAQSGWTSWLGAIFGQNNDATYVMQTGYMASFRNFIDEAAGPRYYTLGGWDYDYFSSLGPSGSYLSSNGYSYFWGGGGNDGVVPYNYSRRPSSTEMSCSGCSATKYDHYELNEGRYVWNTISSRFPSTLNRGEAIPTAETAEDYNPVNGVTSQSIVLTGTTGQPASFQIDEAGAKVRIDIRTMEEVEGSKVMDALNKGVSLNAEKLNAITEGVLGRFVSQYTMTAQLAGKYTLDVEGDYIAVVTIEGAGSASLTTDLSGLRSVYRAGETMQLMLNLVDANQGGIDNASITATARLTCDLKGTKAAREVAFPIEFVATDIPGQYKAITRALPTEGVYNITLDAKQGSFHRSITHSVGVIENEWTQPITEANAFNLTSYPNPFQGETTIRFTLEENEEVSLKVLDIMGREVKSLNVSGFGEGTHSITWNGTNGNGNFVPAGAYLIRMENGQHAQTQRIQILR